MRRLLTIALFLALAAGVYYWLGVRGGRSAAPRVQYRTARVERGEVIEGVNASGTVQPVELIQVGTQISGVIDRLLADFNSEVKAGQTIALLDARRLLLQVTQDEAALARAKAEVKRVEGVRAQARADVDRVKALGDQARANVRRAEALLVKAKADLVRQQELAKTSLTALADVDSAVADQASIEAELDSAKAAVQQNDAQVEIAAATVQQTEAQVAVAEAAVQQSEAQLASSRVNLGYATIVSPVDGIVVSRNVEVGQTVAASLQAPTLFVIARDLTKIQVQTSVPEADIGRVRQGQRTSFGVDAHPSRVFEGFVSQVRLAATTVQNVVTYTVVVDAANPEGLLFPGMTANVTFEVSRSPADVLRVPATALRLQPASDLLEGEAPSRPAGRERRPAFVYLLTPEKRLRPVAVRPGISDGILTVVEPADAAALPEGAEVVTAVLREAEAAPTNPFAPPRMGGGRGGGMR